MSLFDMNGKVVVITGSSRGIGKAIAEEMAVHGARVVISSRKQDACEAVAASINATHGAGTAISVPANISSKESLLHLVVQTRQAFGQIDALVCNAASNPYYGPLAGISDEAFRKILDNNIVANHWLISMVAPEMLARGEGSITIISSIGGLKGSTVIGAYCISKAADMELARCLADEFGPRGVRRHHRRHRLGDRPSASAVGAWFGASARWPHRRRPRCTRRRIGTVQTIWQVIVARRSSRRRGPATRHARRARKGAPGWV